MRGKFTEWDEFEKELKLTPEQEEQIKLEMDLIEATIETRKQSNLTQRELSKRSGISQPIIARIEKYVHSPQTNTLIKLLYTMGYTLKIVPLDRTKTRKK